MDRQPTAVEYRRQLRRLLSDRLAVLDIDSLTLTELRDMLRIIEPAVARAAAGDSRRVRRRRKLSLTD